MTAVPRTLLDLSAVTPASRLRRAIREAEFLGLLDLEAVDAAIERARGRRTKRLENALQAHRPGTTIRSELEHRFLELCLDAGLPQPEMNVVIHGHEVDCLWREHNLVVELDGAAAHRNPRAFEADRCRDGELTAAGLRPVRVTWRRVTAERDQLTALLTRLVRP